MGGPIGLVIKLVGGGIGLASEAIEGHKQKKAARTHGSDAAESSSTAAARLQDSPRVHDPNEAPPEYVETTEEHAEQLIAAGKAVPVDDKELKSLGLKKDKKQALDEDDEDSDDESTDADDEADWALDDAAELADPPSYDEATRVVSGSKLENQILQLAGPVPQKQTRLPAPVILPQRRPQEKGRGFVRAYSPVLADVGISQDCFITFIKNWNTASQASPWLGVVMLGAMAAGLVPHFAAQISAAVVQVAVGTAMELQRRRRTTTFLDTMNEKLFMPRGLYALVFTYKPESAKPIHAQDINLNESIVAREASHDSSRLKAEMQHLKISSGTTYGRIELPEAAPLVYPALDEAAFGNDERKQNALKETGHYMADYLDRRAQARYATRNPGSPFAVEEKPKFASRFSDPNHAVYSGGLIAFVSGGAYDSRPRRQAKRDRKNARRVARGRAPRLPKEQREKKGLVGRALHQNLLYLMIVNMPSDEEIAAARTHLAQLQAQRSHSSQPS